MEVADDRQRSIHYPGTACSSRQCPCVLYDREPLQHFVLCAFCWNCYCCRSCQDEPRKSFEGLGLLYLGYRRYRLEMTALHDGRSAEPLSIDYHYLHNVSLQMRGSKRMPYPGRDPLSRSRRGRRSYLPFRSSATVSAHHHTAYCSREYNAVFG